MDVAPQVANERLQLNNSFRHRCASALMHPATVAAVAGLLLNDVVFKSLWPGSWVTGKLSDLAWVVFASPLLAFLLSFLVGRSTRGQRAAFLASYVGLPLLYAAFNTFEPVHDAILRGLSTASGGTAGSPLDVTDSLVIPFGLGIALWVWRRGVASAESLRMRWGLLIAGVAALASVATSYPEPDLGIWEVGISEDGAVHGGQWGRSQYRSSNGGLTWAGGSGDPGRIEWGGASVETPRGTYVIQGPDIVLVDADGGSELAYSTAYMQEEGNMWVQEHATARLYIRKITTAPHNIVYDERSGNLIAAMGIQGVAVGTPDGVWTRHAVGRYSPVDFSFSSKTGLLLSNGGFWTAALALSLSMIGAALLASQYLRSDLRLLARSALVSLALLIGLPIVLVATGLENLLELILNIALSSSLFIILALIGGAIALGSMPRESRLRKSLGLGLGILSLLASGALLLTFGGSDAEAFSNYSLRLVVFAVPAYVLGTALLAISGRELRHWRVVIPTFLGMNVLVVLAFMLWLHMGIELALAQVSAIVLATLAALLLVGYIKRKQQPG